MIDLKGVRQKSIKGCPVFQLNRFIGWDEKEENAGSKLLGSKRRQENFLKASFSTKLGNLYRGAIERGEVIRRGRSQKGEQHREGTGVHLGYEVQFLKGG